MKILSIRDPWASLIAYGVKDVENRTWTTQYRGPVLIHSSKTYDKSAHQDVTAGHHMAYNDRVRKLKPSEMAQGQIIAVAELVDAHGTTRTHGRWHCTTVAAPTSPAVSGACSDWGQRDANHLVLRNARRLETPIDWKGSLGLRDVDFAVIGNWLAEPVDGCTCAGTTPHEPACGYSPITQLQPVYNPLTEIRHV